VHSLFLFMTLASMWSEQTMLPRESVYVVITAPPSLLLRPMQLEDR
jgi:hypothetical protein